MKIEIPPRLSGSSYGALILNDLIVSEAPLSLWRDKQAQETRDTINLSVDPVRAKLAVACSLLLKQDGGEFESRSYDLIFRVEAGNDGMEGFETTLSMTGLDLLRALDLYSRDASLVDGATKKSKRLSRETTVVAFYLPQFYPFSENDRWWGDGFTEWSNVVDAKPQFQGHRMPLMPADLGFYDLRTEDTRRRQAELAAQYGIDAFCYYFYWFSGRRIMRDVLDAIMFSGEPKTDFCLCWANESWSRQWDGSEGQTDLLIKQQHDPEIDKGLFSDLLPYFRDDRYLKIDGKPMLLIYRLGIMNGADAVIRDWRKSAVKAGFSGLFVAAVRSFGLKDRDAEMVDAIVDFPPHTSISTDIQNNLEVNAAFKGKIFDYRQVVVEAVTRTPGELMCFPGVMPRWDNTARKADRAHIFWNCTPDAFKLWMSFAFQQSLNLPLGKRYLFINSWNEWGEGANLEPDRLTGRAYLEAIRSTRGGYIAGPSDTAKFALISNLPKSNAEEYLSNFSAEVQIVSNMMNWQRAKIHDAFRIGAPEIVSLSRALPVVRDGAVIIDESNSPIVNNTITVHYGQPLSIVGWTMIEQGKKHTRDRVAYFCLTPANESEIALHAPVIKWTRRPDIPTHYNFSLSTDEIYFGFELTVGTDNLSVGLYKICMVQSSDGELLAARCHVKLKREAK
jgi:hypothetical protein